MWVGLIFCVISRADDCRERLDVDRGYRIRERSGLCGVGRHSALCVREHVTAVLRPFSQESSSVPRRLPLFGSILLMETRKRAAGDSQTGVQAVRVENESNG